MPLNTDKSVRIIGWVAVLILLTELIVPLFTGVYTFADAIRGFEIMREYQDGAAFNTLNYPNIHNPLVTYNVSWWAPGQWVVPMAIQLLSGISDLQLIQKISIAFSLIASVSGFYFLFKSLRIDPFIRNVSLLLIITSPLFFWQSLMYFGGDLLTIAFFPWFVLFLSARKEKAKISDALFFFVIGVTGLYIKTSFLLLVATGGMFLFFREQQTFYERIRNNWHFMLSALGVFLFAKIYLIAGETPGSAVDTEGWFGVPNTVSGDLFYSIGSPIGIFTTLGMWLQKAEASGTTGTLIICSKILLTLITLTIIFSTIWKDQKYGKLLLLFATPYLLFFIYFYLADKAVSYEMRHFAPIAFLFFPAILNRIRYYFNSSAVLLTALILIGLSSISYIDQVHYLKTLPVRAGIKVSHEEAKLADLIMDWDKNHSNSLFLMEEYWAPSFYLRKNDKLVLKGTGNTIVSGMELDHTDDLDKWLSLPELASSYNELLIVGYENNSTNLFTFAPEGRIISSGKIGRYNWERIKIKAHAERSNSEK